MSELLMLPETLVREFELSELDAQDPIEAPAFDHDPALPAAITKAASQQTYYTIRFLADSPLIPDAYRAYAYFRWVDDMLDELIPSQAECLAFLQRQQTLIDRCYAGESYRPLYANEQLLLDLIRHHSQPCSGLAAYIRHMMAVMAFDAARKGRLISEHELTAYTDHLATAVTEALHFFIGHDVQSPLTASRYAAVKGAHITHMLRDAIEDAAVGYFNMPCEILAACRLDPCDVQHPAYVAWVKHRVELARTYFQAGKQYMKQVNHVRRRLAGYAYTTRFEVVLNMIEKDGYRLRADYSERKSLRSGLWMGRSVVSNLFGDFVRGLA